MSRRKASMPLYIGDYLTDTRHLTVEQHGAYLLLLMACWESGPLPSDDVMLAAIARTDLRVWQRSVGPVVRRFFTMYEDGLLHQKRVDLERAKAADISAKRVLASRCRLRGKPKIPCTCTTTCRLQGDLLARECTTFGTTNGTKPAPIGTRLQPFCSPKPAPEMPASRAHVVSLALESKKVRKKEPPLGTPHVVETPPSQAMSPQSAPALKTPESKPGRRSAILPDWLPNEQDAAFATGRGIHNIAAEAAHFRDHHTAKGNLMLDWGAAWRNWCRMSKRFAAARPASRWSEGPRGAAEVFGLCPRPGEEDDFEFEKLNIIPPGFFGVTS